MAVAPGRRQQPVIQQQVDPRPRHHHGEPFQEGRRVEAKVGRAVRPRMA